MNNYDQEYYFIRAAENDSLPDLAPDTNTEDRNFRFERQPMGSPPLVFANGAKDFQRQNRIPMMKTPPEILFDGADLAVPSKVRDALLTLNIPNLHMHPAVYIHDDGQWYEDYWYMTFTERFDCWDRATSDYEQDEPPVRLGGFELFQVYTYSLDKTLFDKIPLEQRMLFKMGGTLDPFIACHRKLAHLFFQNASSGTRLQLISDY